MVKCHWRVLEAWFNGVIRVLAKAGVFGKRVTGMADGPDGETTERFADGGQATRKVRIQDKRDQGHAIEVTVYGWKVLSLIDAATKIPLAVKVGKIEEPESPWTRALVTQARTNLAGVALLHKKEAKPPWNLGHPPPKTERAVRVHVLCTLLLCALAPVHRRPCEREDSDGDPVGWQRWRRQLVDEPQDQVIMCAQGAYGLLHLAEYSLLVEVKLKDVPPGIGTH